MYYILNAFLEHHTFVDTSKMYLQCPNIILFYRSIKTTISQHPLIFKLCVVLQRCKICYKEFYSSTQEYTK